MYPSNIVDIIIIIIFFQIDCLNEAETHIIVTDWG